MRYAIVVEKAANNYSAYVPDLPGCVATGQTVEEAEREIREAIEFHIEGMMKRDCLYRKLPVRFTILKLLRSDILREQ